MMQVRPSPEGVTSGGTRLYNVPDEASAPDQPELGLEHDPEN